MTANIDNEEIKLAIKTKLCNDLLHNSTLNSRTWSTKNNFSHDLTTGVILHLGSNEIISMIPFQYQEINMSKEALIILEEGSPEFKLFQHIPPSVGIKKSDVPLDNLQMVIGMNQAFQKKWIHMKRQNAEIYLFRTIPNINDEVQRLLQLIQTDFSISIDDVEYLKHRKLITIKNIKGFELTKGNQFTTDFNVRKESNLTSNLLIDDEWKNKIFKEYNFNSNGLQLDCGSLHPLLKMRDEFRKVFLELGYEEMSTDKFVESSFWNFDSLFQPQSHPARDAQDTFFLSDPDKTLSLPDYYVNEVKTVHESGGFGSVGYRYKWSEIEATKNILRTHTTAVSSRVLYELAQQKEFIPKKYFSIDRVYRNENLDQTHLTEFHQIEGLVIDYDLSLTNLIGCIKTFFLRCGIEKLKFKPAYNPYTEPSMEIFGYHPSLKKWMELGNSGIFRPEMLRPMGFPENVRVIAWGLSLERPTMIKYNIDNIRKLVGHKTDISFIQSHPICRLNK